jgi:uncharacterized protein YggE
MKTSLKMLTIAVLFLLALPVVAQNSPTVAAQPNTIFAGGDGKYESAPDTAVLSFYISAQEASSTAAYEHASKSVQKVRDILRANGIDPKTAEISSFSSNPVYDYKDPKRKIIGYQVAASATIKFKDFTKFPPVLQQLADADINNNQSLTYTLEDIDAAKSKAVEDAYRRARASAGAVAHAAGRTLGELSYASVDVSQGGGVPYPMVPMRAMAMQGATIPGPTEEFTPQKVTVTAHVNALFELK